MIIKKPETNKTNGKHDFCAPCFWLALVSQWSACGWSERCRLSLLPTVKCSGAPAHDLTCLLFGNVSHRVVTMGLMYGEGAFQSPTFSHGHWHIARFITRHILRRL